MLRPMKIIYSSFLLSSFLFLSACGGIKCNSWSGSDDFVHMSQCSDKLDKAIECKLVKDANGTIQSYDCICSSGGTVGKQFTRTEALPSINVESNKAIFNQACAWDVQ